MKKMELELKVLNINEEKLICKINDLGGELLEECKQYLYTYDLPTIYGRFVDIMLQINESENETKKEIALSKLKLLFFELDNLLVTSQKKELRDIVGIDNFSQILLNDNYLEILNKENIINFIKKFHNNPKKWVRLRKTNKKVTIAVKHILAENETNIQQMLETEIEVPNMNEAKEFLQALGFSYKSYQEKKRRTYKLGKYEIDIDTWPGIPTYFEVEGEDEEDLSKILNMLGYTIADTVSCTADEVYAMYGKNINEIRELKF